MDQQTTTVATPQDTYVRSLSWPDALLKASQQYRHVILMSLAVVALAYTLGALAWYLARPSHTSLTLPVRADFKGAHVGEYPNGTRFSPTDIVATPVLAQVFQMNRIDRFTDFRKFREALFISEGSGVLDQLRREYEAKLSEPKLSSVDRDRLETEYQLKKASLGKTDFLITFVRRDGLARVPLSLVEKILADLPRVWADQIARERGALQYRFRVLGRNILTARSPYHSNSFVAAEILRTKAATILQNIEELMAVAGSEVVRSGKERISLPEIRLNLENTLRFRIQPLIASSRGTSDDVTAVRFLEAQIAFNEHAARRTTARVQSLQEALDRYATSPAPPETRPPSTLRGTVENGQKRATFPNETVISQIDDSFVDRLLTMARQNNEESYRRELVEQIRVEALAGIPYASDNEYYRSLLQSSRRGSGGGSGSAEWEPAQMRLAQEELVQAVDQLQGIYRALSANLNQSNTLYTVTGPVKTSQERAVEGEKLVLLGLLLVLFTLPVAFGISVLHAFFRRT